MAYVVARRNGRFEMRESLHTPHGPRSRTLAGFGVLSDDVLERAASRAQRPFDAAAVIDSGRRAGALVTAALEQTASPGDSNGRGAGPEDPADASHDERRGFLAATARMARSVRRTPSAERTSPGEALIDLLGFADAVRVSQPPRRAEPLAFPAIGQLVVHRRSRGGLAHT
jgi:hypothetical protein